MPIPKENQTTRKSSSEAQFLKIKLTIWLIVSLRVVHWKIWKLITIVKNGHRSEFFLIFTINLIFWFLIEF